MGLDSELFVQAHKRRTFVSRCIDSTARPGEPAFQWTPRNSQTKVVLRLSRTRREKPARIERAPVSLSTPDKNKVRVESRILISPASDFVTTASKTRKDSPCS
jgi:hypothetical protein